MLRERLLSLDEEAGVKPSEYAYSLIPIKNILLKFGKTEGMQWLTYVYQMRDPRSFYNGYTEKEKHYTVCEDIFKEQIEIDETVKAALDFYNQHESSTMSLLRAARESINALRLWLSKVDTESDDYEALKHVQILEKMGKMVQSLKILEEAAEKEADESTTYGNVELNEFSR